MLGEGVAALGARTGSLCLLTARGDELEIVGSNGYSEELLGAWSRFPLGADLPASVAVRTDEPIFIRSVEDRHERYPIFATLPEDAVEAHAILPLHADGTEPFGALVLGFSEPRGFSDDDRSFLMSLAVQAAAALQRTTGRVHLTYLAEASSRLAATLDLDAVAATVGELAAPRLCDRAVLYVVRGDAVDVFGLTPEPLPRGADDLMHRMPFHPQSAAGAGAALRDGTVTFLPRVTDEDLVRAAASEEHLELLRGAGIGATFVQPLRARGRIIGALGLSNETGREMTGTERVLAEELAARTAVAVDNALLLQEQGEARAAAERAAERLRHLQRFTAAFSRAMTAEDVAHQVQSVDVPGLGITRRAVWVIDPGDGQLHLLGSAGDAEAQRFATIALDAALPAAEAVRTGAPVIVEQAERSTRFPDLGDAGEAAPTFVVLPLRFEDRPLGVLALGTARTPTPQSLELLLAIADQCAQALERARLYELEQRARTQAVADRQRIQELVRTLQSSLLPTELPVIPGVEVAARYHAGLDGLEVGGDFYDVFDTGGDWAVVIGDVCGKGAEAAAVTAVARSTIRSVAMDLRHPSQVLRRLNDALLRHDLGDRFCTVVYSRLVPTGRGARLVVSRGGHPAPLVRRRDGRVEPIGAAGPLVGVFPDMRVWDETATIEPGDAVVFYTDGVTEARRDDEQFGEDRLLALLAQVAADSAAGVAEAIESAVLDFTGGRPTDDMAIVVLRLDDRNVAAMA